VYGTVPSPLDTTQWADFRFLITPVHVTLNAGDKVSVTASAVFGTSKLAALVLDDDPRVEATSEFCFEAGTNAAHVNWSASVRLVKITTVGGLNLRRG
jgi:hypothetical protein